jgi:signal transduction histidine kinase
LGPSSDHPELRALEHFRQEELLSLVSHELRTPLSVIVGLSTVLVEQWDQVSDENKREQLERIERCGRKLMRLLENVLSNHRAAAGAFHLDIEPLSIFSLIVETLDIYGGDLPSLTVTCPTSIRAMTDATAFQQILLNYVSNAFKYGDPPYEILVAADDGVVVSVCDSGVGVTDSLVPRLFEKFARADLAGQLPGTGLGLFIVRELARAQGGDAWYEPLDPSGSKFCFRLPSGSDEDRDGVSGDEE